MPNKFTYAAVLGAVFMLSPFAIDMYLPALPTIANSLNTGIDALEATVAIYLIGFAVGQLILGPVSDAFGRRKILLGGLIIFATASAMAGRADTLEALYVWRFVQALGMAGSVAVFPLVRARFGETGGAQIISYIMAITVVGPLIAPIIGGYLLTFAGWGAIFYLLAGLGGFAILATALSIRDADEALRPLSLPGIVRAYRIVIVERRIMAAILSGGFAFAGLFAFVAGSPFVYITYFGLAPQNYGFLVGLNAIAMIGINLVNAQALANTDPVAKIFAGGFALALTGLAILFIALLDLGLAPLVAAVVLFIGALGLTATNSIVAALSVLPEENGTVAALSGALQFSIGAFSSLIVSVMASTNAVSMALVMAACGALSFLSAAALKRTTNSPSQTKGTTHA